MILLKIYFYFTFQGVINIRGKNSRRAKVIFFQGYFLKSFSLPDNLP